MIPRVIYILSIDSSNSPQITRTWVNPQSLPHLVINLYPKLKIIEVLHSRKWCASKSFFLLTKAWISDREIYSSQVSRYIGSEVKRVGRLSIPTCNILCMWYDGVCLRGRFLACVLRIEFEIFRSSPHTFVFRHGICCYMFLWSYTWLD